MSTYMYLECQDHDPPLLSYDEVGQHRYDLPRIWDQIRGCDQVLADGEASDYFAYNASKSEYHRTFVSRLVTPWEEQ